VYIQMNNTTHFAEKGSATATADNNLQLLLFSLGGNQLYGINVFKVREIIPCPEITHVHNGHPAIIGIFSIRQLTMPLVDLAQVIGRPSTTAAKEGTVIITEYNQQSLAFLVSGVDRIIHVGWEPIVPPPQGIGHESFITAIVKSESALIEILDVERIMWTVLGMPKNISDDVAQAARNLGAENTLVAAVDDSRVARTMMAKVFESIGVEFVLFESGVEAYTALAGWANSSDPRYNKLSILVADVEMPEMDGPTLVEKIRSLAEFKHLYIVLHSSIEKRYYENRMNASKIDKFITKFDPDSLGNAVMAGLEKHAQHSSGKHPQA